jgi:adenylate cyclase class 2
MGLTSLAGPALENVTLPEPAQAAQKGLPRIAFDVFRSVRQDDQAYAQDGWHYGLSKLGVAFARLRTQDGRHLFTLKRPVDNELACPEFETEVADRDQTVRIVKTRRTARLGELSLCLDEVEHAGVFLEIEKVIGPDQSGEAGQAELDTFARSFGVDLERTTETYDSLVRGARRRLNSVIPVSRSWPGRAAQRGLNGNAVGPPMSLGDPSDD